MKRIKQHIDEIENSIEHIAGQLLKLKAVYNEIVSEGGEYTGSPHSNFLTRLDEDEFKSC